MISEYVREQKRYTQLELCDILHCSEEQAVPLIQKLKEYGILKTVRASDSQKDMSDLVEEDVEVTDVEVGENEYLYVFTFVGVVVVAGRVINCYPKYLLAAKSPHEELQQIIQVLEKYNAKEQIIRMFNESDESRSTNFLAILLFLLNDYYENGIYSNTEMVVENNGSGEILWDKTINETISALSNGRPYYFDLKTRKRREDSHDYIKRLHECVLTLASKELADAGLLELFGITEVDLSDEVLEDFGEKDYALYRLENELARQFNTRKQLVLKTLYAYVANQGGLYQVEGLSLFGTNNFNLVWESVCAEVLDNKLGIQLKDLRLPIPLRSSYNPKVKLIDLIEKPYWSYAGNVAKDTLIPDLASIFEKGGEYYFVIFDAKYYNARLEKGETPKAQPGIESVTKQYLYQLAFSEFLIDHQFHNVYNCFLLPTEETVVKDKGCVYLKMLKKLGLQDVQVRFLPAKDVYNHYLAGTKLTWDYLKI